MLTIVCSQTKDVEYLLTKVNYEEESFQNFKIYKCNYKNNDFIILVTGYGKVNIAVALEKLNNCVDISNIIHIGTASSINCKLKIYDILFVDKVCDYDIDFTKMGLSLGKLPNEEKNIFSSDYNLKKYFNSAIESLDKKYTDVFIASGETFITNYNFVNYIKKNFYTDALDIETSTIGRYASIYNIPFIAVKVVSNYANENACKDYNLYSTEAKRICELIIYNFIKEYFF